mgnify:CR=1 FL=1
MNDLRRITWTLGAPVRALLISLIRVYRVTLGGDVTRLTSGTGYYFMPAALGDRIAFLGSEDPEIYPQNVKVGIIPAAGGTATWVSTALDRTFETTAGTARPVWVIKAGVAALGLMTAPRGAKLPRKMAIPAFSLNGLSNGLITSVL